MSGMTEELAGSRDHVCSQSARLLKPPAVPEPLFPFDLKTAARLGGSELEQNRGKKTSWETTYF